jgi:cell division protein FtsN
MNDHNLDDLIIDTNTAKNGKTKGFLTIIALLIVVLIVAIILTKIILKDPDTDQAELVESNTEMVSPELTLQDTPEEQNDDETVLSEMIESEMKAPDAEEVAKETVVIEEEKHDVPAPKEEPVVTKPEANPKKEIVKLPTAPTPTPKSQPKPVVKKTPPPAKPTVKKPSQSTTSGTGTFYIQVGSFSKTPNRNSRLISAIRKNGYHYKIITAPNGMKKVLIGPYKSRPQVDKAIVRVKDRINKSAFVFKQ